MYKNVKEYETAIYDILSSALDETISLTDITSNPDKSDAFYTCYKLRYVEGIKANVSAANTKVFDAAATGRIAVTLKGLEFMRSYEDKKSILRSKNAKIIAIVSLVVSSAGFIVTLLANLDKIICNIHTYIF